MFKFRFAAICRTDKKSHIHHLSTIASSEHEARRQFASRFVLVLSARIRVSGGWPHDRYSCLPMVFFA
ncbi:host cell division inhibitor Icd-like protein [Klebsiella pneumoniae]